MGRGPAPRPIVSYAEAATATFERLSPVTGVPMRTTLSACVLAASPNTSYAFIASSIEKRWVVSTVGSSLPPSISDSSCGMVRVSTSPVVDGHVLDPELLQVQRHGLAVNAHVGERAAGADQFRGQLEGGRDSDRLDGYIDAETARQLENSLDGVLAAVVDGDVSAEFLGLRQAAVIEVDHDDASGRVQLRGHDRRQADRARANDGHGIARSHAAVLDADFQGRRKDVGQEQDLFVCES